MKFENPNRSRLVYFQTGDSKSIRVPTTKKWLALLFLSLSFLSLNVGIFFIARTLLSAGNDLMVLFFGSIILFGWMVAWGFTIRNWLWSLFGNTTLTVENAALTIDWRILNLRRLKHYHLSDVYGMRWRAVGKNDNRRNVIEIDAEPGIVEFKYGRETMVAVTGVTDGEGSEIIEALNVAAASHDITRQNDLDR